MGMAFAMLVIPVMIQMVMVSLMKKIQTLITNISAQIMIWIAVTIVQVVIMDHLMTAGIMMSMVSVIDSIRFSPSLRMWVA